MDNKIRVPWNCPYNLKTKSNVDPYDSESKYSEAFRAWCEDITEKVNKLSLMEKEEELENAGKLRQPHFQGGVKMKEEEVGGE